MDTDEVDAVHLLLVEDDDGDALLVEELLLDAGLSADVTRAWSLEAALDALATPVDCVLLDLGLPDATGLDALLQLRAISDAALVVLTGLDGIDRGVEAVAAGAQDYLVKGRVDGETLGRAVRYAIERRRGQHAAGGREGAAERTDELTTLLDRLRPGPRPTTGVRARARTEATVAPLRNELWEVVERADGTTLAIFGSARDEGPAAAAQATTLAVSFRALALTGLAVDQVVDTLDAVAHRGQVPADVVVLALDPRSRQVTVLEAGDVRPLRLTDSTVEPLDGATPGGPLGAGGPRGEVREIALGVEERLLLVGTRAAANDEAREATRRELLGLLATGRVSSVSDDAICSAVSGALQTLGSRTTDGHVALLGWTPA